MQHGKPCHIQHSLAVYQLARPRLCLGLAQLINCSGMLDMTRFAMSHSLLSAVYINNTGVYSCCTVLCCEKQLDVYLCGAGEKGVVLHKDYELCQISISCLSLSPNQTEV